MRKRVMWAVCLAAVCAAAVPAEAQYGTRRGGGGEVAGEDYNVEFAFNIWNPDPGLIIASESLGIIGSRIDAVEDLGLEQERLREFRVVLRPSRKFKFRIGYTPIKYDAEAVLTRRIVFNGQAFNVGVPVATTVDWNAWRFGLEWDFIYGNRGFFGLLVDAKYQDLEVTLNSPVTSEFTSVKVPIPTIGGAGRVYVARNVAINGEVTGLKLALQDDEGTYLEWDVNTTVNFTNNVGVQAGYRSLNVDYTVDADFGDLQLKGFYFGGTVRF